MMVKKVIQNMSLSAKAASLLCALLLITGGAVIGAKAAAAASLKSVSLVTSDVLTLGDIFEGVKRNADYVIGAAPQPGKEITLNARTLYRIASAMDVQWRPTTTADTITIRRDANLVPFKIIENSLKKELQNKGIDGDFEMELNAGKPSIILPNNLPSNVEVSSVTYDNQTDYFTATLVAPSLDNPVKTMKVTGMIDRMIEVPVLNTTLQNGDVIGKNDIRLVRISADDIQHGAVMKNEDLIGMTPRRIAHAGKFIQRGTLQKPQLVERGDMIVINYLQGPLTLTAKGKALQSGAIGDVIRITNVASSKTVSASVSGSKEVIVQ